MSTFFTIVNILHDMGITFGVGASTFALTFYINALMDGVIDTSEKRFLHVVYVLLRLGMTLITLALLSTLVAVWVLSGAAPVELFQSPLYAMEWTLMGIIIINALLMTAHKMPMSIGPVLAGGSWYSFFLVSSLPLAAFSYSTLLALYGAFLVIFFGAFTFLKRYYVKSPPRMPHSV